MGVILYSDRLANLNGWFGYMTRLFNECLWCDEPLTKKEVEYRGNFFCDQKCYRTASRTIRMGMGERKSGGKSGIQPMLLGLLLKTLKRHPGGLLLTDVVAITHHDYTDYCKLLNASKLHHYFRIYLNPSIYTRIKTRSATVYQLVGGNCLKDWLRPKYREYLETLSI